MQIQFKSGRKLDISYEIAERLSNKLLEGAKGIQVFSNGMGKIICIINIEEIECIS